jgi:hypothetical protein
MWLQFGLQFNPVRRRSGKTVQGRRSSLNRSGRSRLELLMRWGFTARRATDLRTLLTDLLTTDTDDPGRNWTRQPSATLRAGLSGNYGLIWTVEILLRIRCSPKQARTRCVPIEP